MYFRWIILATFGLVFLFGCMQPSAPLTSPSALPPSAIDSTVMPTVFSSTAVASLQPREPVQHSMPSLIPSNPPGDFSSGPAAGPQNDATYFTISNDGRTWSPGTLIRKQASVPAIVQLKKSVGKFNVGTLLVYFVDFSKMIRPGSENIGVLSSADGGRTWNEEGIITISNKPNTGAAVDPSIVQLSDGSLRLYYFGPDFIQGEPAQLPGLHKVYSSVSTDGLHFSSESGVRFQIERLTDPAVRFFQNQYFMYYSVGTSTQLAVSADGLTFNSQPTSGTDFGGVPGVLVLPNGIRLFACAGGIATAFSSDGFHFTKEQDDIFNGQVKDLVCDPDVISLQNGAYALVYKVNSFSGRPDFNPGSFGSMPH